MNKSNSSEEKELPLYKETEVRVPIHLKITLTIREAAEYSNIGCLLYTSDAADECPAV